MTASGIQFLKEWVDKNVPVLTFQGDVFIRALAQKLRDDAAAGGFTFVELEIQGQSVEQFIRETMGHFAEPGMIGD